MTHCRSFSNFPRTRDGFQVSSVYFVPCPWLIPECRLDRLLILLDTGSNNNVRTTAAKQIVQLAVKSVRSDVPADEWDVKQHPSSSTKDTGKYAELMAVVGHVCYSCLHNSRHETFHFEKKKNLVNSISPSILHRMI